MLPNPTETVSLVMCDDGLGRLVLELSSPRERIRTMSFATVNTQAMPRPLVTYDAGTEAPGGCGPDQMLLTRYRLAMPETRTARPCEWKREPIQAELHERAALMDIFGRQRKGSVNLVTCGDAALILPDGERPMEVALTKTMPTWVYQECPEAAQYSWEGGLKLKDATGLAVDLSKIIDIACDLEAQLRT